MHYPSLFLIIKMPLASIGWSFIAIKNIVNEKFGVVIAIVIALMPLLASARTASAVDESGVLTGVVTRVVDGDTVWVTRSAGGKPLKVRIGGIDAPEICQAGGVASREALKGRLFRQSVTLSFRFHDDYGRALATVHLEGEDMGRWMVAQGQAWSYHYRQDAGPYAAEQALAQAAGRGLFGQGDAENPRSFRQRHGSCYARQHP